MGQTMKKPPTEVCKTMCATCPFREGSPYASLQEHLAMSALTESSRICHSTGTNAIGGRTGKPNKICRGARELQKRMFVAIGFLTDTSDEAWNNALNKIVDRRAASRQPACGKTANNQPKTP
jgi:hypothetical protein